MTDRATVFVTDSNVDRLYGDAFARSLEARYRRVGRFVIPAGEQSKTLETYASIVRAFARFGLDRGDIVHALGGGVVGDLAGFAAATYMRGVDIVQVPTTLLAMVDSSIGGKTGADIPEGKNLVGAFHKPVATVRDVAYLATLPEREMKNGYAEMVKMAVLFDASLVDLIRSDLPRAIERCVELKEQVVAADFREGGRRKLLNLGHTFGHAIEKVSGYSVPHGEAVAMGMRIVGRDVPEIGGILDGFGFGRLENPDVDALVAAIGSDKKRRGDKITLVVPRRVGECELVDVPLSEVGQWLG